MEYRDIPRGISSLIPEHFLWIPSQTRAWQVKDFLSQFGVWDTQEEGVGHNARKVDTAQLQIKHFNFGEAVERHQRFRKRSYICRLCSKKMVQKVSFNNSPAKSPCWYGQRDDDEGKRMEENGTWLIRKQKEKKNKCCILVITALEGDAVIPILLKETMRLKEVIFLANQQSSQELNTFPYAF